MNAFPLLPRKTVLAVARIAASITLSQRASFAFSAEAQQMCSGDAFRLCPSEIPNVPAITACTIRKRASLSPSCRAVLDREVAKKTARSPMVIDLASRHIGAMPCRLCLR